MITDVDTITFGDTVCLYDYARRPKGFIICVRASSCYDVEMKSSIPPKKRLADFVDIPFFELKRARVILDERIRKI